MPNSTSAPKNRLKNLRALEVSCVKSGANRRKWAVIKSEEGLLASQSDFMPAMLSESEQADVASYLEMRNELVSKADGDAQTAGDKEQVALEAIKRIAGNFKDTLTIADLVAMGAQAGLQGVDQNDDEDSEFDLDNTGDSEAGPVSQSEESPVKVDKDMNWQMPKPDGVNDADHQEAMKAAKAAYLGKMGKAEKSDDDMDEDADEVEKACDDEESAVKKSADLSTEQEKYFADVQKRHETLLTKCAELEGRLASMQDEKILKSYEEQLGAEVPNLSIDRAKTAAVLKSLSGNQEAHDAYLATLKAAHEQVSVAKSYGGSLYGSTRGNAGQFAGFSQQNVSGEERMNTMIQEQIKKSGNPDQYIAWQQLIKDPEFAKLYEQNTTGGR